MVSDGASRASAPRVDRPGETRTVVVFLRSMGVVYLLAFVSLWVQISGLIGSEGILPVSDYLAAAQSQLGLERFWLLPTVLWLNASDVALHVVCAAGAVAALLATAGRVPGGAFALAWVCYLSLSTVGQDFLRFQWDGLLLEAGFVAILLAPWRLRDRFSVDAPPSRAVLWLARWLLFRLMLASAAVKLTSGDPTWRSLTALDFHYFTQPLPPWTAWYASHLPEGFQGLSVLVMFACEGLAPFLLFGPRRVRFVGVAAIAGLQALILLTGNYGFFNLLTLALCVPALDDGVLRRWPVPTAPPPSPRIEPGRGRGRWPRRAAAAVLFVMSLVPLSRALGVGTGWLGPVVSVYRLASPLQIVNPYGLFAVMTTERPEIVVEGSADGRDWRAYEFRFKPGDPARRPPFVTPHMPRLDWQMWFAALGGWRQNQWFLAFCQRLLEGSPAVDRLLARDPFPDRPPRFLRARVYRYRFSSSEQRERSGVWWTRTLGGSYVPTLTLVGGRLSAAPDSALAR